MSIQHHSSAEDAAIRRFINETMEVSEREFPHGQVSKDDEGETAFAVAADPKNKIVRIQFTKPMKWIGLDVESARVFKALLALKIAELETALPIEPNTETKL
jgi:hypothetical protein